MIHLKIINKTLLLFYLIAFLGCGTEKVSDVNITNMDQLIILEKSETRVGVLSDYGGRIVLLQKNNSSNILKSDSELWNYKFDKPIQELILFNKTPFNGHIVWVGPQSEWWTQQNVNQKLNKEASHWPPDPYLIYGKFKVTERNKNSIKLVSPKSEYTGVQLTNYIEILDDGKINFNVEAENIRDKNISWDLWLNTRMDGFSKVYVPIESGKDLRMQYRKNKSVDKMPYEIEKGYFHFNTKLPSSNKNKIDGKAFIYPSTNKIFAFTEAEMFVISFKKYDKKLVHLEQAMIEIYNSIDDKGDALMELEYHTPYQVIKPKEKIYGDETWDIVKYRNGNSNVEHINFINAYLELTKSNFNN